MQRCFNLSEKPPSQTELARIAGVGRDMLRRDIELLLKMMVNRGHEIVQPIPLGLYQKVKK